MPMHVLQLNNARAIVISIGVNDLWYRQHDEIILRYEQLLADLPDNVPVVANALFPIQEGLEYGDDTNARISHVNQSISEVASRFDNVLFVWIERLRMAISQVTELQVD